MQTTTSLRFAGSEFFTAIGAASQPAQKMAVQIKGHLVVQQAGDYVFYVNSSDGSKVRENMCLHEESVHVDIQLYLCTSATSSHSKPIGASKHIHLQL
jgi:hypothetical protein